MLISPCGIDCWNESMELSDVVDYIYLDDSMGHPLVYIFLSI